MAYIALDRRFIEFDDTEDAEEAVAESLAYRISGQEIKWRDVHSHRFVVILGEAGTGKTTEFEEEAQRLRNDGRQAFFIPLEDLADERISADIEQTVEDWKQGADQGVFFLDAVDEARLSHPVAFRRALDALARLLRPMESRSTIVVSCRISDWQYRTDAKTMVVAFRSFGPGAASGDHQTTTPLLAEGMAPDASSKLIPLPPTSDWEPAIKLYQLAPLDSEKIARLADFWGVANVDQFMTTLEDSDLQSFARRPRDLDWLVNYWQQHGAFGSLAEMLEENIRHKLEEHNPAHDRRPTGLTPQRCREGVEALAAACVLCERPLIALPDPEIVREPPARYFTPGEVLSGWTPDDIRALLTRAIFDQATFGRVRFHDSTVREYLAACWMANRINAGQRLSRVRRFVLGEAFGELRPVPSKRAVLGWLALKSPAIRQDVITVAPDVILYCGDASQIPVEERGRALRNLASLLSRIGRTDWTVYDSDVRRLADPRLEPVVRDLFQGDTDSPELIHLLLRMVRLGPMPGCADLVLNISLDPQRDVGLRIYAAHAVVAAGTAEQHATLLESAVSTVEMSNRLLGGLCAALFPDVMNVQECLAIARKAKVELPNSTSGIGGYFEHNIVDNCPRQSLQELLGGLLDMARTPPMLDQRGSQVVSEQYAWTLEAIIRILPRILTEQKDGDIDAALIAQAYKLLDDCQHNPNLLLTGEDKFKKALAERAILHKPIFWFVVRQRLTRRLGEGRFVWHTHSEMLVLDSCDLEWLLNDIRTVADENELDAACETALEIWYLDGRPDETRPLILEAVEQSAIASADLKQRIKESLWPPPREESDWERKLREQQETRERAEQAALEEIRVDLTQRVEGIRIGAYFGGLFQCYQSMRRGDGASNSSWAQTNWPDIVADFGTEIADAAQLGFKISWRGWRPPLPSEREETQGVENGVCTGLTGLELMARDGEDLSQLSREEAECATHYAVRELNGFPDWLPDVAEGNPDAVREVLSRQLEAEFAAPSGSDANPEVLSRLRYGPEAIRTLCVDTILELLTPLDEPNHKILSEALEVLLLADDAARAKIGSLFFEKAQHYASTGDDARLFLWLEAWFHVDAAPAVRFLEDLVAERGESPSSLVQKLAASLGQRSWGSRDPGNTDYLQSQVLERLIPLVNAHIRVEDDPDHDGVCEINEREDAQSFRNALPKHLANQKGADAQRVLQNLAASFDDQPKIQTYFRRLAEQQAAIVVEYPPRSPQDVAAFGAGGEMDPKTGDELYEIALDRLDDIREDIETGDFSDRHLFFPRMPEKDIQIWLSGRLHRESGGMYSVTREEEIDLSQKTDIRLHHPAAGCVTIEIKPVESGSGRYSFNQLVAALQGQLVGQYMRAANSRHGILVVAMLAERHWNAPAGGGRLRFAEVIDRFNAIAVEIVQSDRDVEKLCVIGINFSET